MNQVPAEEFRPGIDGELTGKETRDRRQGRLREPKQGGRIVLHTKARKVEAEGGSLRVGGGNQENREGRKGRQTEEDWARSLSKIEEEEEEGAGPKGTLLSGKMARGTKT